MSNFTKCNLPDIAEQTFYIKFTAQCTLVMPNWQNLLTAGNYVHRWTTKQSLISTTEYAYQLPLHCT